MEDKSRVFKDFNFKLIVINSLIHKHPSYENEFENNKSTDHFMSFLENILLTDEDMDKVDCIQFGDNLEIYKYILEEFDKEIKCMDDMELLYNLKSIEYE